MANPERTKKSQLLRLMEEMPLWVRVRKTIPHAIMRMTTVRMAVAKLEFTPSIPILAKIEVRAAKMADNREKMNHMILFSFLINEKRHVINPAANLPLFLN